MKLHTLVWATVAATLLGLAAIGTASADDNVKCVQQELTSRGLDPGATDGAMGKKTIAATQTLKYQGILPDFSAKTAKDWYDLLKFSSVVASTWQKLDDPGLTETFSVTASKALQATPRAASTL